MSVSRCQLFEAGFPADILHLNDPSCRGTVRNGRVEFHFDNDEHICGTNLVVRFTKSKLFKYTIQMFVEPELEIKLWLMNQSLTSKVTLKYPNVSAFFFCWCPPGEWQQESPVHFIFPDFHLFHLNCLNCTPSQMVRFVDYKAHDRCLLWYFPQIKCEI